MRTRLYRLLIISLGLYLGIALAPCSHAKVMIAPKTIETQVINYVQSSTSLDDPHAKLLVECTKLPTSIVTLSGDEVQFSFEDHRATPVPYNTLVTVTITTDTDTQRLVVPVKVLVERPVWVVTKVVRSKSSLTRQDIRLETKKLGLTDALSLNDSDAVTQYSAKVNLTPGMILNLNNTKQIPTVATHDEVRIILALGNGVQVTSIGQALEEGAQGQKIRVLQKREGGKPKIYSGQVIGKNTILVKL